MFLTGVVGCAMSSLAAWNVGTTGGVIAFRALQGAFGSLLMANTLGILRATFPQGKLNMAIDIRGGGFGVSVAADPIVGGVLVQNVSWESVFYLNVPVAAIALAIRLLVFVESLDERPARFDLPGVALFRTGLFGLVFGLIDVQTWSWASGETFAFLIGSVAALGAFVLVEQRVAPPLPPMRLFANRSLRIGTLVVVISS